MNEHQGKITSSVEDGEDRDNSQTSPTSTTTPSSVTRHHEDIQSNDSPKQLSTRHAFAVLVSLQIGSGIFASPAQVDSNVPSPGVALLIWLIGGLLSWAGAASFAELGAALPLNGGMQEYLRYVYGDTYAFLMAWIYIIAVKPSSMAIQSIVIADSIMSVAGLPKDGVPEGWLLKLFAISALVAMVLLNSISTKTTLRASESFTVIKLTTVLTIVIAGVSVLIIHVVKPTAAPSGGTDWYSKNWFHSRPNLSGGIPIDWTEIGWWELLGHYSAAIYASLWAYDGWDSANFVASEIRDPGRSLPLAIHSAMIVVLACYELVNTSYYILLPWDLLGSSSAVAVTAAKSLLGYPAGVVITILVSLSCAGAITSNLFSVGRLTVAASQRGYLPQLFGNKGVPGCFNRKQRHRNEARDPHPSEREPLISNTSDLPGTNVVENPTALDAQWDAPIIAMLLSMSVTAAYIAVGDFPTLLTFVGMAEYVFYVSTVIALIILRYREPDLQRPYRPLLVIPVIFCLVGTAVIVRSVIFAPLQGALIAVLIVMGSLVGKLRG
ncbi:amino acid transporter [Lepidopterella palustris CBS 459.81]|uniref:Amino acid transporter n=1 Tax=Lepidopterella palustris CBS 459.81 TaxID=1314670 RepID=A0A8E2JGZ6_9PEZI|nr:amino acid transporter [Lepidopterella palustris CBS 459.81]